MVTVQIIEINLDLLTIKLSANQITEFSVALKLLIVKNHAGFIFLKKTASHKPII